MSDPPNPEAAARPLTATAHRRRFSFIWLVPIAAVAIGLFLGYRTLSERGPLVTVTFSGADGLSAGQTAVRFKAVQLGTVESITLDENLQRVRVRIRMSRDIAARLTDRANFWVVRPRLSPASISGLETIVSGSYIEFDPGQPGGEEKREFVGLEDAPGIRSNERGRLFSLRATRLGSLDQGSPVFFRDVQVGQVVNYDEPGLDGGGINVRVFVRSPFDQYLHEGSRFWNTSGVRLSFGAQGVKLELESLRALLAGGVAFDTPPIVRDAPIARDDAEFELFEDFDAAMAATSKDRVSFLLYFDASVRGLAPGSPVEMRGLRIGTVTDVQLQYVRSRYNFRVSVRIVIEPDRISFPAGRDQDQVVDVARIMVAQGLRAQLASGSLLTGQKVIALDFLTNPPPAEVIVENDDIVLPVLQGGDDIMTTVGALAGRIERFPLDEIGRNLNATLESVNGLIGGPEIRATVTSLAAALAQVQELVRGADRGLQPLLRRLPAIAGNLDQAVARANSTIGSIEGGYGKGSDVQRQLERLLGQATDTARSVRLLADYLDRHPEALVRGRATTGAER